MLKRYIKTSVAVCVAALGLSSCSSDEMAAIEETGQSYMAHVTLTASRAMFGNTRSSLNENDPKDGELHFSWELNDVIYVTNTENVYKGRLVVKNIDEAGNATFEGQVKAEIYNGTKDYVFYFLGNNTKIDENTGKIESKNYDFSNQDGLLSTLSDDDLLIKQATMTFTNGAGSVSVVFERQFAYAHYKLVYDGNALDTHGVPVTISATNLSSTASVDFTNKNMVPGEVSSFTVTPSSEPKPDDENGFYVGLVPNGEETTLTFTCKVDGIEFTGTRHLNNLAKNNFYRKEATKGAIPIEMTPSKQYRVIYHINITDIDKSDPDGVRICTSLPDAVTDPTNYTVLNFTEPNRDDSKEIRNEANFTKGYLYEFLGWSTEKSAATSWAADNLGAVYKAKEDSEDATPTENGKINLTTVTTTETVENGQKYYDLHLYAKGSVMQYTLICKQKAEGNGGYDAWSGSGKNRLTGWCEIKLTGGVTIGNKQGYEFKGWSRKDINGNLVDEDNPIQWDTYVRINKNDPYGDWDPNFTGVDGDNRPIKGQQILKLYPVWKLKDPEVIAPGADGDVL